MTTTPWTLAIDFGTTATVGAMAFDGQVEIVETQGAKRLPSSVLVDEKGTIVVGNYADSQAMLLPDRYEPTPKRRIGEGEMLLGDRAVEVVDLVAAVLAEVAGEATRRRGGPPSDVRLTCPAVWALNGHKRAALVEAAARAGLADPVLVPEPEAAATHFATRFPPQDDRRVAVYDLGGGTFDAAVVTADTHAIAGPPGGVDPLGGEDFDEALVRHIGETQLAQRVPEEWAQLYAPATMAWRRHAREFRFTLRRAKEALSKSQVYDLFVPGANTDAQLTRPELERIVRPDLSRTIDEFVRTVQAAGLEPRDLGAVYLAGGQSRMPVVAQLLWEATAVRPLAVDDPKAAVALGAARWTPPAAAPVDELSTDVDPDGGRWARDPSGRFELRYWDGRSWTEHVATKGWNGVDPASAGPVTPPVATDQGLAAPAAPSNWYPDPSRRHQQRYWDGQRWTEHVSDYGRNSSDPVGA